MRMIILAMVCILTAAEAMAAEQTGRLEPGASVTLETAASDLTEITLKNDANQKIIVQATGATTRVFEIDPVQTVGTLAHLKGAKLILTNKGAAAVAYKVGW